MFRLAACADERVCAEHPELDGVVDRVAKRALLFLSTDDDLDLPDLLARMEVAFGGVGESP